MSNETPISRYVISDTYVNMDMIQNCMENKRLQVPMMKSTPGQNKTESGTLKHPTHGGTTA